MSPKEAPEGPFPSYYSKSPVCVLPLCSVNTGVAIIFLSTRTRVLGNFVMVAIAHIFIDYYSNMY